MNISVYITSYNKSKYLHKAIESVLNQSYKPFEIIIVDNNSEDKSRDIIHSFYNRYPNIIIPIYNEINLGISNSRNIGLRKMKGEIVTFLDGDDYYYPKKLEYEYSLLQNSLNVQAAFSNFHYINERGEVTGRFAKENDTPATGDIFINTYTRDYHVNSRNNYIYEMFYKKCLDKIGYYDPTITLWEDWDFRIRFSKQYHYGYCSKINSVYRKIASGIHNVDHNIHFREQIKIHIKNKSTIQDLKEKEIHHIQNRVFSKIKNLFIPTIKSYLKGKFYLKAISTCVYFIFIFKTRKSISIALKTLLIGYK